jgi:hypothetical protein
MAPSRYYSSVARRTTLTGDINSTATTMTVAAATGYPSTTPYTLIIDQDTVNEEIVEVTARSGTSLTITRGVDGTTGIAHTAGAAIEHGVSARDFGDSRSHEDASENVHGTGSGSAVVGTTDTQTLTNKTLTSATLGGDLDAGSNKITDLADPTLAQDAVTKNWAETAMSSQLTQATTQATNAATSATAAATSETNAATSETNAATSATNAATSETNAATSATNAATSESNASTSETNAAASATAAATSEANAGTSETNAATSATNAATSETNSAASAVSAANSAAAAATALDNFDDRYLGQKASAPTVDNDGDPLITGALYFDTTASSMYVYDGAAWNAVNAGTFISETLIDAKGDLIVGSADNTAARLAVGTDGFVLTADSAEATGLKWSASTGGGAGLQDIFFLMGA